MAEVTQLAGGDAYAPLEPRTLPGWLAGLPGCTAILGGRPADWRVEEVGDGNLNLVFIVRGAGGSLVVKQALPYVRLVGESWPLPLERAFFEHAALVEQARHAPDLVPGIHHFDAGRAAIVMEHLTPHIILRKGLIRGIRYPRLAGDLARFMAETLFRTSDLAVPAADKKAAQAVFCRNTALCKITEDLVFTDPYRIAELNRWTSPQLDDIAAAFRADAALKVAVQELKWGFLHRGEALVHGDLHTGSVMVTASDTRVIDPEFAFYGPMGFDVGALIGNLLLAFFAQEGHEDRPGERAEYEAWLLETAEAVWTGFRARFLALWRQAGAGDAFSAALFEDDAAAASLDAVRAETLDRLFADALGYAGAKMIRRILGLAHVEDLESIADLDRRGRCERRALELGRSLILERRGISDVGAALSLARDVRAAVA